MKTTSEDCIRAIRAGADPADCFKMLLEDCPGSMGITLWGVVQRELGCEACRPFGRQADGATNRERCGKVAQ
jgi:hypothetical protein